MRKFANLLINKFANYSYSFSFFKTSKTVY